MKLRTISSKTKRTNCGCDRGCSLRRILASLIEMFFSSAILRAMSFIFFWGSHLRACFVGFPHEFNMDVLGEKLLG